MFFFLLVFFSFRDVSPLSTISSSLSLISSFLFSCDLNIASLLFGFSLADAAAASAASLTNLHWRCLPSRSISFAFISASSPLLRMHIGTSPSMRLRPCLDPPPLLTLSFSCSLRFPLDDCTQSLRRVFFAIHFPVLSRFQLQRPDICHTWELHLHMFWSLFVRLPTRVLPICSFWTVQVVRCGSCECSIWLMDPSLFWRNLSSTSMVQDIFIFRPLSSFFKMFADLTNLSLSSLSLTCKNARVIGLAGHLILIWSIGIPIEVMISSACVVSSWNPVTTAPLLFWSSCELFPSVSFVFVPLPLLFVVIFFLHGGDLLVHSVIFVVAFFLHFSIVVFAPCSWKPTDSNVSFVIFSIVFVQNFRTGLSITSSDLFEAMYISLLKIFWSHHRFVFPNFTVPSSQVSDCSCSGGGHRLIFFHSTLQPQCHLESCIVHCVVFLDFLLFVQFLPWFERCWLSFGICIFLSISSLVLVMLCLLSQFMLFVFPLFVLAYTVM